jgi:hypothetical protein
MRSSPASWIACRAGGIARPESGAGITSGPPDTQSITTVSPGAIVSTGAKAASKIPNRTVSGVEAR